MAEIATEVHTRFLHPLRWSVPRKVEDGAAPLEENGAAAVLEDLVAKLLRAQFRGKMMWEPLTDDTASRSEKRWRLYRTELYEQVADLLFPKCASTGCSGVRLRDDVVNTIFGSSLQVRDPKDALQPWRLDSAAEVEIFLSPHGIGVLSIRLSRYSPQPFSIKEAQNFNYRLAQQRPEMRYRLCKLHVNEDAERQELMDVDAQSRTRSAPERNAGLTERLGYGGGWFNLVEFKDWLLEPLHNTPLIEPRRQFQVYSVVRCGPQAGLDAPELRDVWATLVADLGQIQEPAHAGTPLGLPGIPCALLNRHHWTAVSSLGAAHIVADQGLPFDNQRVSNVRDKYFAPFLLATFQAHYYEHTAAHLSALSQVKLNSFDQNCSDELSQAWLAFLEFDGQYNHTHISEREVANRWYALARTGLGVALAHDRLSNVMRELDAFCRLQTAEESRNKLAATSEQAKQSVEAIKHTQEKIEWVEIFLVGVYSVYLIHYLAEDFHFREASFEFGGLHFPYVGLCLITGTLFASITAAWLLKPWRKHRPGSHDPAEQNGRRLRKRSGLRLLFFLVLVVALLAGYVWEGMRLC